MLLVKALSSSAIVYRRLPPQVVSCVPAVIRCYALSCVVCCAVACLLARAGRYRVRRRRGLHGCRRYRGATGAWALRTLWALRVGVCFRRRSHGACCVTPSSAEDGHTLRTGGGRHRERRVPAADCLGDVCRKGVNGKNTLFSKNLCNRCHAGYCRYVMKRESGAYDPHDPHSHDPHDSTAASRAGESAHDTGFDSDGGPGAGAGGETGFHTSADNDLETAKEWTLEECPVGQDMRVTGVRMDERHVLRMLELGIRAGGLVRVTQRSNFGGRVIAIGTGRIAIDAATAQSITVRPAEPNTHGDQS